MSRVDVAGVVRAVRAASGLTQYDFAEWLSVSRKTVQRWEAATAVPDARAEEALVTFCRERGAFAPVRNQALAAVVGDEARLREACARARGSGPPTHAGAPGRPGGDLEPGPPPPPLAGTSAHLFGRDEALARLAAHLVDHRLVTVTGPGGVGKTSVALAAAASGDGRVRTVFLAPVPGPEGVLGAVAAAVGARQGPTTTVRESVAAALADGPRLLLLDNFEHVLGAAPVVADLLESCPDLTVLITSRAPLRLAAEHEMALPPLALPDLEHDPPLDAVEHSPALRLFVARARRVDPSFTLTLDGTRAAAEICAALGGLPLAIELAAARVRLLPPVVLRDRLGDRLRLLRGGPVDAPARQQTLEATLDWSHDLLTPVEQVAFRRLAVFAGAFSLADAEAVLPAPGPDAPTGPRAPGDGAVPSPGPTLSSGDVVDALGALVDHNLVQSLDHGTEFGLTETVRTYALERLAGSDDVASVRDRHAAHLRALTERDAARLHGPEQRRAHRDMSARRPDADAALDHLLGSRPELALRLAVALAPLWDTESALAEARRRLDQALAAAPGRTLVRATASCWAGYFAALQLDIDSARGHAEAALDLADEWGNGRARGYALLILGDAAQAAGDDAAAVRHFTESLAALRGAGDAWGSARPLNCLAEQARSAGDLDAAREQHVEALAICREIGDRLSEVMILCGIGHVHRLSGDLAAARESGHEAVDLGLPIDNGVGLATAFELLAAIEGEAGEHERAAGLWGAADRLRRRTGSAVERRDQADQAGARARSAAALGQERFRAGLAAGGALSTTAVVDRYLT